MVEFTESDVARLAEMLPDCGHWRCTCRRLTARGLLAQGVTLPPPPPPPPDPADVVAGQVWNRSRNGITHTLRDLFPPEALAAAAAKVQEADRA